MNCIHNEVGDGATASASAGAAFGSPLERLFELAALLGNLMDAALAEHGLSRARAGVIWYVHRHGPATQRELSQALRCTPRNVTGLLDALEAAGLVARAPHPTDRRAALVTLTEQGVALAEAWHAGYQEGAARLFDGIAAAELDRFLATVDTLLGRLRRPAPAGSRAGVTSST